MRPLGIKHFLLDPHVAHLNHGSFGAVPRPVIKARWDAAAAVERSPRHYRSDLSPALASARTRLASFPGVESASLAWVKNASEAMQVILHAVAARPGEEILLTEHAYSWVQAAVERTALVVLDQITSASALRLPLEQVLAAVPEGIPVAIDGAHAPGLIPRLVPARASFWFGNLHKWAFAPRSVAALVVAPAWRARVRPLIASAIAERGYPEVFDVTWEPRTPPPSWRWAPPWIFPVSIWGSISRVCVAAIAPCSRPGLRCSAKRFRFTTALIRESPCAPCIGEEGDLWSRRGASARRCVRLGLRLRWYSQGARLYARVSVQAYVGLEDFWRLREGLVRVWRSR